MSRTIITIPNHHPNLAFLARWPELKDQEIIVMQDIGEKPRPPEGFTNITVYDHKDVEKELGKNAWIIPTQSSACRSFAYYKAWQRNPDYIITLDNDCFPERPDYFLQGHIKQLETPATLNWEASNATIEFTRGYPYLIRSKSPTMLNHGMWSNVPDLDAATWLQDLDIRLQPYTTSHVIPRHNYFPMCGMNLAWKSELTPALYFGLFGPDYGFDQFDDIWAGVLVKKVVDYFGWAARSGYPSVIHEKQSNVFVNLKKQAPGMAMNEEFWKAVDSTKPVGETVVEVYRSIIEQLPDIIKDEVPGYTKKFKQATLLWLNLFQ